MAFETLDRKLRLAVRLDEEKGRILLVMGATDDFEDARRVQDALAERFRLEAPGP